MPALQHQNSVAFTPRSKKSGFFERVKTLITGSKSQRDHDSERALTPADSRNTENLTLDKFFSGKLEQNKSIQSPARDEEQASPVIRQVSLRRLLTPKLTKNQTPKFLLQMED